MLLRFNKNRRFIVALDLSYTNPVAVPGNLRNEIVAETDIRMTGKVTLEEYMQRILDRFSAGMARTVLPRRGCEA